MSRKENVARLPEPLQVNLTRLSTLFRTGKFPDMDPHIAISGVLPDFLLRDQSRESLMFLLTPDQSNMRGHCRF